LEKLASLIETPQERTWLDQVKVLYTRYAASFKTALIRNSTWNRDKTEISDGITASINEMIRFREETAARQTAAARDQATLATGMITWLAIGGIGTAVVLTYIHARGVSKPVKKLTQELLHVGKGEFRRSLDIRGPREVKDLARAFNWMAARLAELDQMKADFMAHVSHELRTPLTGVQEGTALLLENTPDPITPSQREILEVVHSHSARLSHWIAAILDLSKMEAGMMEYLRIPCDFATLIDKSTQTIQLVAQKKAIILETSHSTSLPPLVVDEGRLQQVLNNLLSNAVKFTPEGGTIRVSTALLHSKNGQAWLECRVADTGIGIPPDEAERIFVRFYQSPYHRQHGKQGTGLGLAIARYIVEAHGGKIWAESRMGEGATFIFTLPVSSKALHPRRLLSQRNEVSNAV
jgi:two-component system sensor histidine kinase GlrK